MKHKISLRTKDGSIQATVAYKYDDSVKWHTKSKQGFKKQSDANRWASAMVVELADMEGRHTADENMTLGDAIELFKATKSKMAANTRSAYNTAMKQLRPFWDIKLNKLNAAKCQQIAEVVKPGNIQHVRSLWNYMLKMDLIKKSYLELPRVEPESRNRIISRAEYDSFIASDIPLELRVFCIVAHHTGMRAGEILGLEPSTVKQDRVIVVKQWNLIDHNVYGFKELKNKKKGIREIPLSLEAYRAIQSLPFNFKYGRYFTYNSSTYVSHLLKKHGLNHSAHDFRHTRASEMIHQGHNIRYVAYILGDTLDTVIKTYISLSDEMKKEEDQKFLSNFCR